LMGWNGGSGTPATEDAAEVSIIGCMKGGHLNEPSKVVVGKRQLLELRGVVSTTATPAVTDVRCETVDGRAHPRVKPPNW